MTVWTILAMCIGLAGGFLAGQTEHQVTLRPLRVTVICAIVVVTLTGIHVLLPWSGWRGIVADVALLSTGYLAACVLAWRTGPPAPPLRRRSRRG
jgi:hypothetical protein